MCNKSIQTFQTVEAKASQVLVTDLVQDEICVTATEALPGVISIQVSRLNIRYVVHNNLLV